MLLSDKNDHALFLTKKFQRQMVSVRQGIASLLLRSLDVFLFLKMPWK